MKIIQESPSRMVLKDHNYSFFLMGILFVVVGGVVAYMGFMDDNMLAAGIGLVFIGGGIYMFVTNKMVTIVLDRQGMSSMSLKSLLKRESRQFNLSDISELIIKSFLNRSKNSTYYDFSLVFVMKNREEMQFEFGREKAAGLISLSSPFDKKKNEAQQVANFIGVPLKEIRPPSLGEVFGSVKDALSTQMKQFQEMQKNKAG